MYFCKVPVVAAEKSNRPQQVILRSRDRPKPLFPVTAVTETAAETTFSVSAETAVDAYLVTQLWFSNVSDLLSADISSTAAVELMSR